MKQLNTVRLRKKGKQSVAFAIMTCIPFIIWIQDFNVGLVLCHQWLETTKLIVVLWPWHWSVCSFWYHNFNNYSWTGTSTLLLYHTVHHLLHVLNSLGLESTAHNYNHSVSHSVPLPRPLPLWRCGKTPTFSLLTHFSL